MEPELKPHENLKPPPRILTGPRAAVIAAVLISGALIYASGRDAMRTTKPARYTAGADNGTPEAQSRAVTLPIRWGDTGIRLVESGVIDFQKLETLYAGRGGVPNDLWTLLAAEENDPVVMNPENAGSFLNLLWAFGLANKNSILENGPMQDPRYGGAGRFASTGGWTLAAGDAMTHYARHEFVRLTPEQQTLVERVARGIYRPCCDNATYFPDCNHGMAMLGLLELMAASGATEDDMYRTALAVNELWFPDTYETIRQYLAANGAVWETTDPKIILGREYSSGSGYANVLRQITNPSKPAGGSCGV